MHQTLTPTGTAIDMAPSSANRAAARSIPSVTNSPTPAAFNAFPPNMRTRFHPYPPASWSRPQQQFNVFQPSIRLPFRFLTEEIIVTHVENQRIEHEVNSQPFSCFQ